MFIITATPGEIDTWLHSAGASLGASQFTFSTTTAASIWPGYAGGSEPFNAVYSFADPALSTAFEAAIGIWDSIIAPDFTEVADDGSTRGEVRVAYTNTSPAFGYAYSGTPTTPGGAVGDVWMDDSAKGGSWALGTHAFESLLHEIGHTLGLKHPFDVPVITAGLDDTRYTIMSYTDGGVFWVFDQDGLSISAETAGPEAITPMVLDIAAAQAIYGAETTTRTGDNTYTFTEWSTVIQTIYDAGGTDTVDTSNFLRASLIDLRSGAYSSLGYADAAAQIDYWSDQFPDFAGFIADTINAETDLYTFENNLGIAIGTIVENAIGGAGNDTIIGNDAANMLDGGAGSDALYGGLGGDSYKVDSALDVVFEGVSAGTDGVTTTASYYLYANIENLTLAGGAGDIYGVGNTLANTITGNTGANLILGGDGDDTLHGSDGGDQLYGEAGADTLFGDDGVDYLIGGIGNDTLDGGEDADGLYGEDGNDTLYAGDGFVSDILSAGAGNDTLYGNSGLNEQDFLDGAAGDDTYYVDTTYDLTFEAAGGGTDTVYADVSNVPNAGVYLWDEVENLVLVGNTAYGVGNGIANTLTGSDFANWLLGGAGNDTLNAKGGDDVLFGEAGSDTFVFDTASGADVIGDFNAAEDTINLDAYNFASFAALQANFVQNGAHGAIMLGGGNFIVLHNVTMSTLNAGDFVL